MKVVSIGNINIFTQPVANPYTVALASFEGKSNVCLTWDKRREACEAIMRREPLPEPYEVWLTPSGGPAHRLTKEDLQTWAFV